MAPAPDDSIKYGSLACGHTTWVLRAITANCACTDPKLGDGLQYSAEVIGRKDAGYEQAVRSGFLWAVLKWWVACLWPEIPDLLQSSRNAAGHVQRP